MSIKHCYILVEGQQDVLFLGRIFQTIDVPDVQNVENISSVWNPLVNTARWTEHRGLIAAGRQGLKIHELFNGACFQNNTHSIVVRKVGGRGREFRRNLESINSLLDGGLAALTAVGLVPDSDDNPQMVRQSCEAALRAVKLPIPQSQADLHIGQPNTGIYPLPRPKETGAVEDLMLDCAQSVYPTLHAGALAFIDSIDRTLPSFTPEDLAEFNGPRGRVKAAVGCISSFLKPGSTVQVSILKDRWVSPNTVALPRIHAILAFLKNLCELP
jgi:hypothetical protein